jgi:hypothetical protein
MIVTSDDAASTWLVALNNNSGQVHYFSYTRSSRQGSFQFEHQPSLSRYILVAMEAVFLDLAGRLEPSWLRVVPA